MKLTKEQAGYYNLKIEGEQINIEKCGITKKWIATSTNGELDDKINMESSCVLKHNSLRELKSFLSMVLKYKAD